MCQEYDTHQSKEQVFHVIGFMCTTENKSEERSYSSFFNPFFAPAAAPEIACAKVKEVAPASYTRLCFTVPAAATPQGA
jgi:hypothetical protein